MRKTLLLGFFALIAWSLQAQPVLTQSAVGAVGSTYYLGIQDTFAPGFSLGSPGANQVWDFASLLVNDMDTINFVDPSTTTNGAEFPTSNLAIQQASLNGGYAYFLSSAAGLDLLGLAGDLLGSGTVTVVHQNPASRVAAFPTTYGSTYVGTTTIDVTIDASGFGIPFVDSARYKNIQDRDVLADGYGSITLPVGQFTNALRVREIIAQKDSIWIHSFLGWNLYQDSTYTDSTFTWWNTTKGYYLAQANYVGGALGTFRYQDPVIVSVPEPSDKAFEIYPIPATDRLYLRGDGKAYTLTISDLQGRMVRSERVSGTTWNTDVSALPRGYYLYTLHDKAGAVLQSGKLLLTH